MPINTERDLERAVEEFQRLSDAPAGSQEERRRRELDAEIKAFYVQNMDELRVAKPRHE